MTDCYTNPEAIVECRSLASDLGEETLRVIEVDADTQSYARGHIPGALAWHWYRDLTCQDRRAFIDQARLSQLLSDAGVDAQTSVVLYGGSNNWFAAYAYWLLRYLGFSRVALLNGGKDAWERQGYLLTRELPTFEPAVMYLPGPRHDHIRATRDGVLGSIGRARFVDARLSEEYQGQRFVPGATPDVQDPGRQRGRIPGAVHIPWHLAVREDGSFKSASDLWRIYGDVATGATELIVYCLTGARSAHTWFVLKELLGVRRVRNYDGSWSEYGSLVDVPIERPRPCESCAPGADCHCTH
jgi:thiosulfate/3-mercaptopyruvate sulfurtransferase